MNYRTYNWCPGTPGFNFDPSLYDPTRPCDGGSGGGLDGGHLTFQLDRVASSKGNTVEAHVTSTNDPKNFSVNEKMTVRWTHDPPPTAGTVIIKYARSPYPSVFCDDTSDATGVCGA